MRITRDLLIKLAKEAVAQQTKNDRNINVAFLLGSVATMDDPLLGGTTDIDILFLCENEPSVTRQVIKLSNEVTLDLMYARQKDYEPPRKQRSDPWRGYVLYDPQPLYETRHFFEFAQASVRSEFDNPANVLARARYFSQPARASWMELQLSADDPGAPELMKFLHAVGDAANAVAVLSGPPLTDRRLLSEFPTRAVQAGLPELTGTLFNMLGIDRLEPAAALGWLGEWQSAVQVAIDRRADPRLHALRLPYYRQAVEALLQSEYPSAALWLLLEPWTVAAANMSELREPAKTWYAAMDQMGLVGDQFADKMDLFDQYLDRLEETLEQYAISNGLMDYQQ